MLGVVGAGGEKPPATRFLVTIPLALLLPSRKDIARRQKMQDE
jgi:hypothetical protein